MKAGGTRVAVSLRVRVGFGIRHMTRVASHTGYGVSKCQHHFTITTNRQTPEMRIRVRVKLRVGVVVGVRVRVRVG